MTVDSTIELEMTKEQADALRARFPDSAIGKLPKGGAMLDYVGHAAVTDRLLSVDPGWTWEPCGTTENGLPLFDGLNGLWIKLTVCGVTRYGYGDGPDPKQCISDAIRNAAMRFGVALDLWSKEEFPAPHAAPSVVDGTAENAPQRGAAGTNGGGGGNDTAATEYGEGLASSQGAASPAPTSPDPARDPASATIGQERVTFDTLSAEVGSRAKAREVLNAACGTTYTGASVLTATDQELTLALETYRKAVAAA